MSEKLTYRGPSPQRKRIWNIMFTTALTTSIVFSWVFSSITIAVKFGCPISDEAYCENVWGPVVYALWATFVGLMGLALGFLIFVIVLRYKAWYKGPVIETDGLSGTHGEEMKQEEA